MALAIDASTPTFKPVPISGTSVASNVFSPPANSVIVLMVVAIGPSGAASSVSSVTDSLGSHLTWGLIPGARSNTNNAGNLGGTCEVWYASCPSAQTNMTVTPTYTNPAGAGNAEGFVLPIVFTGADTTQNGAVATDPQTAAALPSKAVTTTRAGSRVIGCALNYTNATGPTPGTGQTNTINGFSIIMTNATDGDAAWGQMQTANTSASGTVVTINDTAPSCKHNMVVVEILAAAAGGTTFTSTLSATGVGVASISRQPKVAKSVTGVGAASVGKLTAHNFAAVSGTGLVSVARTFGRSLSASGIGLASAPVKSVRPVKFVFGVGVASRSAQVQGIRSASGTGLASVVKLTAKPLTASGIGLVGVTFSKAKLLTLTASGIGLASVTRQAQTVKATTGVGVPSVIKVISETRTASGIGLVSLGRQAAKTLTSSGTGLVSIRRTAAVVKAVTGIGLPSVGKVIAKTRTATGVGVVVLVKQDTHSLTASGVGLVSVASLVIPFVPAGPQTGFVELFVSYLARVDLPDGSLASVTLNLEPLATVDLYIAKVG